MEACILVRERDDTDVDFQTAAEWKPLRDGPVELVARLRETFGEPKDLLFGNPPAARLAVPQCDVEWLSLRVVVVSNPLKSRDARAQLRLEPLSDRIISAGELVLNSKPPNFEFEVFDGRVRPILLHPIQRFRGFSSIQKCCSSRSKSFKRDSGRN